MHHAGQMLPWRSNLPCPGNGYGQSSRRYRTFYPQTRRHEGLRLRSNSWPVRSGICRGCLLLNAAVVTVRTGQLLVEFAVRVSEIKTLGTERLEFRSFALGNNRMARVAVA